MDVYVKTAGKRIELEYEWYRVAPQGPSTAVPPVLRECRVESLTQDQSFSVVLARSRGRLMLLVGWMESGRADFAGRPIRNFVAWVGGPSDEQAFRGVAAHALRGGLDALVDEAITEDSAGGFSVALEKLEAIPTMPELAARVGNGPSDPQPLWGANTDSLRLELAGELERQSLPEHEGPLVIVTGIVSPQKLAEAGVWRALASRIEASHFTPIQKKKGKAPSRALSARYVIPLLVFLLIFLIALVITRLIRE